MDIVPLAAESLGTRSMATWVGCRNKRVTILIDPGVSLAKKRFGLKPHILEVERNLDHWAGITSHLEKSKYVVISHYHYDHHNPRQPQVLSEKTLFVKSPALVNKSQKKRSRYFLEQIKGYATQINHADWREFELEEGVTINFSGALPHGPEGTKLGYIVGTTIVSGSEIFTHSSDVLGIQAEVQLKYILEQNPTILYVDGPSIRQFSRTSKKELLNSMNSLETVIAKTQTKTIILDHHLLRDLNWATHISQLLTTAEDNGIRICTAAEFLEKENDLLEAKRKLLYENKLP
ncbi:MAG: MBL fold metallo-hydrolase [Candidatus Hodarchaeales archaeon]|jgi:predicted metallo-beta-lactamase superfamily hydrolase